MFRWRFWVLVTLVHTPVSILRGAVAESLGECRFPRLVEATVDQLQAGLQKGCFGSVDLVNVGAPFLFFYLHERCDANGCHRRMSVGLTKLIRLLGRSWR